MTKRAVLVLGPPLALHPQVIPSQRSFGDNSLSGHQHNVVLRGPPGNYSRRLEETKKYSKTNTDYLELIMQL